MTAAEVLGFDRKLIYSRQSAKYKAAETGSSIFSTG